MFYPNKYKFTVALSKVQNKLAFRANAIDVFLQSPGKLCSLNVTGARRSNSDENLHLEDLWQLDEPRQIDEQNLPSLYVVKVGFRGLVDETEFLKMVTELRLKKRASSAPHRGCGERPDLEEEMKATFEIAGRIARAFILNQQVHLSVEINEDVTSSLFLDLDYRLASK